MSIIDFIAVVSFGLTCFSIGYTLFSLSVHRFSLFPNNYLEIDPSTHNIAFC